MICSRRTGSALTHTGSIATLDTAAPPGRAAIAATHARTLSAEIDAMAIEDDLSGHDTADVEEIVDEARHVHGLAVDDVAGVHSARLAQPCQTENLHRALDGAQRIAQFVREHREEFVLRLALALHFGRVLTSVTIIVQYGDVFDDRRG